MSTSCARARKLALKLQPPTILIEYEDGCSIRVRAVKLPPASTTSCTPQQLASKVLRSFPPCIDPVTVSRKQLESLLQRLFGQHDQPRHSSGAPTAARQAQPSDAAAVASATAAGGQLAHQQQWQRVVEAARPDTCSRSRGACDAAAAAAAASVRDQPGATAAADAPAGAQLEPQLLGAGMDGRLGGSVADAAAAQRQQQQQQQQQHGGTRYSTEPVISFFSSLATAAASGPASAGSSIRPDVDGGDADDDDDCLTIQLDLRGDEVDLNRASDFELRLAKAQMDLVFRSNLLAPGDPGYEYDKKADFTPGAAASEWDDE